MSEKESVVEIEDVPEVVEEAPEEMTAESLQDEGVGREQIKLAEKHGLLKDKEEKDGEHEEQLKPETDKDKSEESEEKTEEEPEEEVKPTSFEEIDSIREKDPEKFKKFDANEKALYHRWKSDKRKRQEAQTKADELQQRLELSQVQDKGYKIKVDKISEALKNPDLTVEQLQAIIGVQQETVQEVKEEVKDSSLLSEDEQKNFVANRILQAEEYGKDVVDNFDDMVALATEVIQTKPVHQKTLNQALMDESISEPELVDLVMDIARLHKDFGKESQKESSIETNEKVERIEKNAKKAKSSAAISGGRSVRKISEDDLTPEDATSMSSEQWIKLKPATRKRLLGG